MLAGLSATAMTIPRHRATPDDVLEFLRIIWEMNHHLQSVSKRMAKALGVTGPQRLALRMIGREPGMPTLRLATLLHLHPSTVTGILDRLERDGLVERTPDPGDARSTRLRLTKRGRRLDEVRTGTIESAVSSALGELPTPTVKAGRTLLTTVCTALESMESSRPGVRRNAHVPLSGAPRPARRRRRGR
jgi:DNA-binding MarR family transcriptional regulator